MTRLLAPLVLCVGCATASGPRPATPDEISRARPVVALLAAGSFDEARHAGEDLLRAQPENSRANAVVAVVRYKSAMHQLFIDLMTVVGAAVHGAFNHKYMRSALEDAARELAAIDGELTLAAKDPAISMELCLACWQVDWNHNGRVDLRDRRLLEVEQDADGNEIPEGDPRRRPTFRFDVGDLHWARAMVSFQRAFLEVILAYRWEELDKLVMKALGPGGLLVVRLGEKDRVAHARQLVLTGLDEADRSREAILAETDDDREWLPSPRQKSHPLPLPVDDELFATWKGVTEDLRRLARGQEGLSAREAAQLGEHVWDAPPGGFIDIGRLFSDPRDLSFDMKTLDHAGRDPEAALSSVFGVAYVPKMTPSGLLMRLLRMKGEMDRGKESFERKLRYLLWLN